MSLKISNLTKSFDKKSILKDFSYSFNDNGIYVIKGESGAGKTTLLRMIAGLDKNYTGSIEGGGIGMVGMAFQEYRLFPQLSALDNIVFANSDEKDEAVLKKAKRMLIHLGFKNEDLTLLPSELSGGMKQRVSLVRAFLSDFPILLFDEPTKELDENNAKKVRDIITMLSKEKLILIVSHNSEDISELNATEINIQIAY